jgi:S-adenosylmethionine synthetase
MKQDFMFASESVTEGHPDKMCDQISDAIVDRFLQQDPFAEVSAECAVSKGILFIAARFRAEATVDIPDVARQVIGQIGYERDDFNARSSTVMTSITSLPLDGRWLRDERELASRELDEVPARQMANAFGFACRDTASLMPLPVWLAHKLARRLAAARLRWQTPYLAPDGKTQVGVEYRNRRPARVHSITLIASQVDRAAASEKRLRDDLMQAVVEPAFADEAIRPDDRTLVVVNPEGPVVPGGPTWHSGLTGRKNAIDTYGEYSRHGESALSGKDPMRIDRTGTYIARFAAKQVVAAGLADECEVALTYAIGQAQPASVQVETFGSGRIGDQEIAERLRQQVDFRPAAIVAQFNLRRLPALVRGGFYKRLAAYGQVGRMDIGLPWEATDRAVSLGA